MPSVARTGVVFAYALGRSSPAADDPGSAALPARSRATRGATRIAAAITTATRPPRPRHAAHARARGRRRAAGLLRRLRRAARGLPLRRAADHGRTARAAHRGGARGPTLRTETALRSDEDDVAAPRARRRRRGGRTLLVALGLRPARDARGGQGSAR